jgi:MFS family permease
MFLATLTGSPIIIGAVMAIRPLGMLIPQIWTAHKLRNRTRHKPFLVKVASVSRIGVSLLAIVLFVAGPQQKTLILITFLLVYTALWLSEGAAMVPWTDMVAKTVPERLRGRLFGNTQAVGAALSALVALFATTWVLSPRGPGYPLNYGILMFIATACMSASYVCVSLVREPEGDVDNLDLTMNEYTVSLLRMIKDNVELRRFLSVLVLLGCFGMALPFFILYARDASGIAGSSVGTLVTAQVIGLIVFTSIAGYISDHIGPRATIIWTLICGAIPCGLAAAFGHAGLWLWIAVFVMIGAFTGSIWVGTNNYLLEMAVPSERKSYICLMHLFNGMTAIFPVIGGGVVQWMSYPAVFAATMVLLLINLVLALRLRPLRKASTVT